MVYWQSVMKIRKQLGEVCHEKLLNIEFAWGRNSLCQADTVSCLTDLIDKDMDRQCIGKTKNEKAARPSGVVPAMVKEAGEEGHHHRPSKSGYSRSYYSKMGTQHNCKLLKWEIQFFWKERTIVD